MDHRFSAGIVAGCLLITAGCAVLDEHAVTRRGVIVSAHPTPSSDCTIRKAAPTPVASRPRSHDHHLGAKISFPCGGWTPIEPGAADLPRRWREAGVVAPALRAEAIHLAGQHALLAVADHSADFSAEHSLTVYTADCAHEPHTIADEHAELTADLARHEATGVHITFTTVGGYPALKSAYTTQNTGPYRGGPLIRHIEEFIVAGGTSCRTAMTTDQPSRYGEAAFDAIAIQFR